jgi:hypothetical protein
MLTLSSLLHCLLKYLQPGNTVKCNVLSIHPFKVTFSGDLSQENNYYNAYFKVA